MLHSNIPSSGSGLCRVTFVGRALRTHNMGRWSQVLDAGDDSAAVVAAAAAGDAADARLAVIRHTNIVVDMARWSMAHSPDGAKNSRSMWLSQHLTFAVWATIGSSDHCSDSMRC